jgi:hypothetical protein
MTDHEIPIRAVNKFFKDHNKSNQWYMADNPLLGGVSPFRMVMSGRGERLLKFIQTSLNENKRKNNG